ncbi:hypothetical protein [Candidatus Poriferisodalis sp.]|uniref:hypothetical protein n=1 Tax=Candidatus Poriferisodalis sp. TaxID=3101277 RepID=UPI003AF66120
MAAFLRRVEAVGARRSVADVADLGAADAMVTMEALAGELPLADVVVLTCPLTARSGIIPRL